MKPLLDAILFVPAAVVPFERAWRWQGILRDRLLADPSGPDALVLLQHPSCYTLGRGSSESFLRFPPTAPPAPLFRIDRGGEVTHHLPGQLVAYPVLNLQRHGGDLHLYLRRLERVVIDVLAALGLAGERVAGLTGVWLEGRKVAAIGVGGRRWITQHGLAINVNCELTGFSVIVPCGLHDRGVGRLSDWIPGLLCEQVQPLLSEAFASRFGWSLRPPGPAERLWE